MTRAHPGFSDQLACYLLQNKVRAILLRGRKFRRHELPLCVVGVFQIGLRGDGAVGSAQLIRCQGE